MNYLVKHKDTLAPELRQVWGDNGFKTSGTWEEVFGPGKPQTVIPLSELSQEEYQTLWRHFNWPVDEIFMAWRYAGYINKVAAAGKARIRHSHVLQHLAATRPRSAARRVPERLPGAGSA